MNTADRNKSCSPAGSVPTLAAKVIAAKPQAAFPSVSSVGNTANILVRFTNRPCAVGRIAGDDRRTGLDLVPRFTVISSPFSHGSTNSVRDPNLIIPNRSPAANTSPA